MGTAKWSIGRSIQCIAALAWMLIAMQAHAQYVVMPNGKIDIQNPIRLSCNIDRCEVRTNTGRTQTCPEELRSSNFTFSSTSGEATYSENSAPITLRTLDAAFEFMMDGTHTPENRGAFTRNTVKVSINRLSGTVTGVKEAFGVDGFGYTKVFTGNCVTADQASQQRKF